MLKQQLFLLVLTLTSTTVVAQVGERRIDRSRTNRSENGDVVPPGTRLPVIKAHDEAGETISTASLRGNYNVLVFGCLT